MAYSHKINATKKQIQTKNATYIINNGIFQTAIILNDAFSGVVVYVTIREPKGRIFKRQLTKPRTTPCNIQRTLLSKRQPIRLKPIGMKEIERLVFILDFFPNKMNLSNREFFHSFFRSSNCTNFHIFIHFHLITSAGTLRIHNITSSQLAW